MLKFPRTLARCDDNNKTGEMNKEHVGGIWDFTIRFVSTNYKALMSIAFNTFHL